MKLPGINYGTQVQSLGREDVQGPGNIARATIARNNAATNVANVTVDLIDDYQVQKSTYAADDNDLELQRRTIKLLSDFDKEVSYSSDHEYVRNTPGFENDSRDRIPASELRGPFLQARMGESIDELSSNIHRDEIKKQWVNRANQIVNNKVGQFMAEGVKYARQERAAIVADRIQEFIDNEDYDLAQADLKRNKDLFEPDVYRDAERDVDLKKREYDKEEVKYRSGEYAQEGFYDGAIQSIEDAVKNNTMPEAEGRELIKELKWQKEADSYEHLLRSDDEETLLKTAAYLRSKEYSGEFTPKQARQQAELLESRVDTLRTLQKTAQSREKANVTSEANAITKKLNSGYAVDIGIVNTVANQLNVKGVGGGAYDNLMKAVDNQPKIAKFSKMPLPAQERQLSEMRKYSSANPDEVELVALLEEAYSRNKTAVYDDIIIHSNNLGLVNTTPLVYESDQKFQESLQKRLADYTEIKSILGPGSGMLAKNESRYMAAAFNDSDAKGKLALMGNIFMALGPDAGMELFEQLKTEDAQAYQAAAQVFVRDPDTAVKILEGERMVEGLKQVGKKPEDLLLKIDNEMKLMYGIDHEAKMSARKAALQLMAFDINNNGNMTAEKAVEIVTGGKVAINGVHTVKPIGVKEDTFQEWTQRINPEFIDNLTAEGGGLDGLTSVEFSYMLRDGDLTWRYAGPNKYWFTYQDENGIDRSLRMKRGGLLIVNYDEAARMHDETMDNKYLKEDSSWFGSDVDNIKDEYRSD